MGGLQTLCYISILFFIVVVVLKMAKIARMPVHLRWDLYPIPHEKGKAEYGGSYFEDADWWTKPANTSMFSELKEMAKEIIFIQSLFNNNRLLWIFSFPFHFGMYCLIGFIFLLVFGAILGAAGIGISAASANGLAVVVYHLTVIIGTIGWILAIVGAVGLLICRSTWGEIRKSTVRSDYTNLLFLLAVFVTGFVSWLTVDPGYSILRGFVRDLITFRAIGILPMAVKVQLWVTAALLFYYPFTHMTHLFGKYFTYHWIRWEDSPNVRGGKIEKAVSSSLGFRQNWSAPHIKSGSTWAEAATDEENNNG